jgi:hypothetical protein
VSGPGTAYLEYVLNGPYYPPPEKPGYVLKKAGPGPKPEPRDTSISSRDDCLAVAFGNPGRIPPRMPPAYMNVINDSALGPVLHLILVFGRGEWNGVVQDAGVDQIFIDDKLWNTYGQVVQYEIYTGTAGQTVCGLNTLGYDTSWTDPLTGQAYIYMRIAKTDQMQGFPRIEAIWETWKCYDHRSGLTTYTTNPALHIAKILMDTDEGGRLDSSLIDWTSFDAAADYFDVELTTGPLTEKRFEFNWFFGIRGSLKSVIDRIRSHCLAGLVMDEATGKLKLIYAHPLTEVETFTEGEILKVSDEPDAESTLECLEIPANEMINRITWDWLDRETWDASPGEVEDPGLGANDARRDAHYDFRGCGTYSQSLRLATYLINAILLSKLRLRWQSYNDKGLQQGDRIGLTHSLGAFDGLPLELMAVEPVKDGPVTFYGRKYDGNFFLATVTARPTYPDTTLPNPADPPPDPINLSVSLINLASLSIKWEPGDEYPFLAGYQVWVEQPPTQSEYDDYFADVADYSDGTYGLYTAYINTLYELGITVGCGGGNFCPADVLTRKEAAVWIIKMIGESGSGAAYNAYFSDIANDSFAPYINRMYELGITDGCGVGLFCPDDPSLRKTMAVWLVKAIGERTSVKAYDAYFSDIDDDSFAAYINKIYEMGLTTGTSETTFSPDSSLTRREMAVFVVRTVYRSQFATPVGPYTLSATIPIIGYARRVSIRVWAVSNPPYNLKSNKPASTVFYVPELGRALVQPDRLKMFGHVEMAGSGSGLYFPDGSFLGSAGTGSVGNVSNNGDAVITADADESGAGDIILKRGATIIAKVSADGLEILEPSLGLVLKSPGGTRVRLKALDSGKLDITTL